MKLRKALTDFVRAVADEAERNLDFANRVSRDADWPPSQTMTITDLVAEARAAEWDFTNWCHASGYDASDPDARRMFECLLAYARREGRAGLN